MNRSPSFATRAFLLAFVPMALTLAVSFVTINKAVEERIKSRLQDSLRNTESVLSGWQAEHDEQRARVLSILTDSPSLKAGIGLLRETHSSELREQAVETIAYQLRALHQSIHPDLLLLEDPNGLFIVGFHGAGPERLEFGGDGVDTVSPALLRAGGTLYRAVPIPVNLGNENLGSLVVGDEFDFSAWNALGHTALLAGGEVLAGTLPGSSTTSTLNRFVEDCGDIAECELEIDGEQYLSLEIGREGLGEGIRLVSFQSLDQASKSFTDSVAGVFPVVGGGGLVLALVFAFVGSRTIAKPVVRLASALSRASDEGGFPEEIPAEYQAAEVNILAKEFSRAAVAVRDSERRLDEATEEFIESMSQAQDARDPYTAGHSERVSESSVAMARVLGVPEGEIDVIRIGAKMHDLGKIGIPDAVLRKPGRLTPEEYELIQRHPIIGKEILEKVGRFDPFLPIVELHHENPDGSGYPYGLRGRDIPLAVRIVHVADVYDAITSDRAYRSAMADEDAWDLLLRGTGTLFDPRAVEALWSVVGKGRFRPRESVAVGTHENDAAFYSLPFAGAQG